MKKIPLQKKFDTHQKNEDSDHSSEEYQNLIKINNSLSLENSILKQNLKSIFKAISSSCLNLIGVKDPVTKEHSERVALLTVELARAVDKSDSGKYADVHFSEDQIEEMRLAALFHDFGKVCIRDSILQKEKKLFPQHLENIRHRISHANDKLHISILENHIKDKISNNETLSYKQLEKIKQELYQTKNDLEELWSTVLELNDPDLKYSDIVSKTSYLIEKNIIVGDDNTPILSQEEIDILKTRTGSLTSQERTEIENHVTQSYEFLAGLPWSHELENIPEIVFCHHEKLDGTGYPRKLNSEQIPFQAKIMSICDIFDALIASDRPYKKGMSYEQALGILQDNIDSGKLDGDVFKIFVESGIYRLLKPSDFAEEETNISQSAA